MEQNPNTGDRKDSQPVSLKDQIISRIREQDQGGAATGEFRQAGPVPTTAAGGARRFSGGAGIRQMAAYCRQLATLLDVGIPLLRSLQILGERSSSPRLRRVSQDLARRVEEGQPLSTAMLSHQHVFSSTFVGVVRTGEAGGILEGSLRRLADMLERRAILRRRVIGAMLYPAVALLVELAVIVIILVYGLPRIASAYPDPAQLPATTRGLLAASAFLSAHWPGILAVIALVIGAFWLLLRSGAGRYAWQRFILSLPIFGTLSRKMNVEQFSRTLGSLTAAGIPLIDALAVTADTSDNEVMARAVMGARQSVEKGGKMESSLRSAPVFDPMMVDMVMVGDEAGALDSMLLKIADNYDAEVDASLKAMTSVIEPLLIVSLGIAVGFIAVAVFQPYVGLVKNPALMVE